MGCNSSKGVSETSSTSTVKRTKCGSHLKTVDDLEFWP